MPNNSGRVVGSCKVLWAKCPYAIQQKYTVGFTFSAITTSPEGEWVLTPFCTREFCLKIICSHLFAVNALALLVGRQIRHLACKMSHTCSAQMSSLEITELFLNY